MEDDFWGEGIPTWTPGDYSAVVENSVVFGVCATCGLPVTGCSVHIPKAQIVEGVIVSGPECHCYHPACLPVLTDMNGQESGR